MRTCAVAGGLWLLWGSLCEMKTSRYGGPSVIAVLFHLRRCMYHYNIDIIASPRMPRVPL
jgi:hypothetical protein